MYYDTTVAHMQRTVLSRQIHTSIADPAAQTPAFFRKHAVRLFLEVPAVPGVTREPAYRYVGDFFLQPTETFLGKADWAKLRTEVSRARAFCSSFSDCVPSRSRTPS